MYFQDDDYFTYEVVMPLTVFLMIVRQFAYTLFYETPDYMFVPNNKGEVITNTFYYMYFYRRLYKK